MFHRILGLLLLCQLAFQASAGMTIEIIGGAANKIPIAILPFHTRVPGVISPAEVVSNDLANSGFFRLIDTHDNVSPADPASLQLGPWKTRGADAVLIGQIQPAGSGQIEVQFRLMDSVRQASLAGLAFTVAPGQLRAVAHKIADAVHQALLGEPGNYAGRVAYVLKHEGRYELQVADVDGFGAQWVVRQKEPLISPTWSRDSKRLAYVSFEQRKPVVHVLNLVDGSSRVVANFKGSNSAPAWSPDGRRLAVALSKDETSQIYFIDLDSGAITRFTQGGHRTGVQSRRSVALLHLRPRRQPADLSCTAGRRRGQARHLRRRLQRLSHAVVRWKDAGLRPPRRRRFSHRRHGPCQRPDAGTDRYPA